MQIDHAVSLQQALSTGVNLFLGAGFSVLARDSDNRELPVGAKLGEELRQLYGREDLASLPLSNLVTVLRKDPDRLDQYLRHRFTVSTFDPLYRSLTRHAVRAVFTTNVDDLIPKVYRDSNAHYLRDVMSAGPDLWGKSRVDYVPLHGTVSEPASDLYFEAPELAAAFSADPTRWQALSLKLASAPTVFWGYSMGDPGIQAVLNSRSTGVRERKDAWIVLREEDAPSREYFSALGFHIAIGETKSFLEYLEKTPTSVTTQISAGVLGVLPELQVPDAGRIVEVRPLEVFFQGDEPTWYDIGSAEIPRTSHFYEARELVLGNL